MELRESSRSILDLTFVLNNIKRWAAHFDAIHSSSKQRYCIDLLLSSLQRLILVSSSRTVRSILFVFFLDNYYWILWFSKLTKWTSRCWWCLLLVCWSSLGRHRLVTGIMTMNMGLTGPTIAISVDATCIVLSTSQQRCAAWCAWTTRNAPTSHGGNIGKSR